MTTPATAKFQVKNWDEKPYHEGEGKAKLTRASVKKTFTGDFEGESTVEYVMAYPGDGSASFVGIEHLIGKLGGRTGSFVLQHTGTDDGQTATGTWQVVPGSGTGELKGLSGKGQMSIPRDQPGYDFALDYALGQ